MLKYRIYYCTIDLERRIAVNNDSLLLDNGEVLENELSESDFKLLYLRYIEGYS